MPVDFRIDVAAAMVFSEAHGRLEGDDLIEFQTRLRAHPDFRDHYRHLLDLRTVDKIDVPMAALRRLAEKLAFRKGTPQAYVVSSELAFAVARVFRALAPRYSDDLEIFRDIDRAREWLGDGGRGVERASDERGVQNHRRERSRAGHQEPTAG
jgi:hypothetical protein